MLNTEMYERADEFGVVTPHEVREQFFERFTQAAIAVAQEPGDYTIEERCVRVVHEVLDVIDAKDGNKPTGEGLPLMQMLLAPHPDYEKARMRHGEPVYDVTLPFNYGLVSGDYNTGTARAYADYLDKGTFEGISARSVRSAKEMFGGECRRQPHEA
jgi:hypothetical protein